MAHCSDCPRGTPRTLSFGECAEALSLRETRSPLVLEREEAERVLNRIDVSLAAIDARLAALGVDPTS